MGLQPNELPKPNPDLKLEVPTTERLQNLKNAVEDQKTEQGAVKVLLEKYLENAEVTDGKLPDSLTPDKAEQLSKAFTKEQILSLSKMVLGAKLKADLGALADRVTPGETTDGVAKTESTNPLLKQINKVLEMAFSNPALQPLFDKLSAFGIKKETILSGAIAALGQALLRFKNLPPARAAAAELAFNQMGESIANDAKLAPAEKAKRAKAFKTEEGRRNFMIAFDNWVEKGTPMTGRPGSAELFAQAPAPAQVAQAPAAAPVATNKPQTAPVTPEKVEVAPRTVNLVDGTKYSLVKTGDKFVIDAAAVKREAKVAGGTVLDIFVRQPSVADKGGVDFKLTDNRTITVDPLALRDAVQGKKKDLLATDNVTKIDLAELPTA